MSENNTSNPAASVETTPESANAATSRRRLLTALSALGGAATFASLGAKEAQAQWIGPPGYMSAEYLNDLEALRAYVGHNQEGSGIYIRENVYVLVGAHTWQGQPDGGEGWFVYDPDAIQPDNDGTIIKPNDVSGAGRWIRAFQGSVSVKWFGARGDYDASQNPGSDDTLALQRAFAFVLSQQGSASGSARKPGLFVPRGTYRVTSSALFSPLVFPPANGFRIHGEGWRASVLVLDAGPDAWFYDNGENTKTLLMMQFESLAFLGATEEANGFRLWSDGHEQGFRFTGCWFGNLSRVIQVDGTANASENSFINCRISAIYDAVWVFNNPQSVANEFHATDLTNVYGDLIRVESGGGGSFRMFGGTLTFPEHQDDIPTWLVNVQASSYNLGGANNDFLFYGAKVEMHGEKTGLVSRPAGQVVSVRVVFEQANFATTTAPVARTVVDIRDGDRVSFNRCTLPWQFEYVVGDNGSAATVVGENGTLDFIDCQATDRLAGKVFFAGAAGQARARGCHYPGVGTATVVDSDGNNFVNSGYITVASDFDLKSLGRGYMDQSGPVKYLAFSKGLSGPIADQRRFAVLPPGALLLSAFIHKVAGPATGTAQYALRALEDTPPDSIVLAESQVQAASEDFRWTPELYWRVGTSSARGRTIELSSLGTMTAAHWPFEAMLLYI